MTYWKDKRERNIYNYTFSCSLKIFFSYLIDHIVDSKNEKKKANSQTKPTTMCLKEYDIV